MLHAKFQNNRPSGSGKESVFKVFAIYSHGGHLGHVTLTIYTNFHSPFLRMLHMTFGFDWRNGSEKKIFEYYGNIYVYCPGVRADVHLGSIIFRIINLLSICPFP